MRRRCRAPGAGTTALRVAARTSAFAFKGKHEDVRQMLLKRAPKYGNDRPAVDAPYPDIRADCQVGGLVHICRLQYGACFKPASASLRRRKPKDRAPWDELFGVPVTFEAAENAIRVQTDVANKLLTSSSKELFYQHYETLALTMADLERSEIVGRARHAIHQLLPSGGVTEEKIAALVNTTPRTLHRRRPSWRRTRRGRASWRR